VTTAVALHSGSVAIADDDQMLRSGIRRGRIGSAALPVDDRHAGHVLQPVFERFRAEQQ
jgi:hypothetical protein